MPSDLYLHPLFQVKVEDLTADERIALSYQRAGLLMSTYSLTADDVLHYSPKFWDLMLDPICCLDLAMFTILTAHATLVIGTLSRHLHKRPDLRSLVAQLLRFDTVGIYLLSERGHGLDAYNNETTATKTADGFILHTPREEATKFMPASTPSFGIPKVAVVNARLIVDEKDCGSRFFIVPICDKHGMYRGVSSIRLPPRSGTSPLDFALTSFDHVHLPHTALVSSDISNLSRPAKPLEAWWDEVWRVKAGSLAISAPLVPAIKLIAYIGGRYSMHRRISQEKIPIITFRTQQWPVAHATAVGLVLSNWFPLVVRQWKAMEEIDNRVSHGIAAIVKTTVTRHLLRCVREVSERCGAQGTFEQNLMAQIEGDTKGVVIADGDIMTICIRLFSELLLKRYQIPLPPAGSSLLARHVQSLFDYNSRLLGQLRREHRSKLFNSRILPQSQLAIEAMGHALAYAAGVEAGLPQPILDVYECAAIRQDPAWYVEQASISQAEQRFHEEEAIDSMLPDLSNYLSELNISNYVSAPIVSDQKWKEYVAGRRVFTGNAAMPQAML